MISLFGSLRKSTAIVLLGAMFFWFTSPVFATVGGGGPAINYFTSSISPATITAGVPQTYTMTITNSSSNDNNTKIGSIKITIPSGWTSVGNLVTNLGWNISTTTPWEIQLTKIDSNDVGRGNSLTLTFTATAPGSASTSQWTTKAFKLKDFKQELAITGSQATVSVVSDVTPPVINAHANISGVPAIDSNGAIVTFTVNSTDDVDGTQPASCSPASGSVFPIGTTTVTCTKTDVSGKVATPITFTVEVVDTTAPVINVHANISGVEATGSTGAAVTFTVNSTDNVDGLQPASCSPASGSTFPLGTTTVTCDKTDSKGNVATSTSFTVEVVDTTAPSVGSASDMTISTSGSSSTVTYTAPTATDLVDGDVSVNCAPSSGSVFTLGTTNVSCSATDSHGKTGSSSFYVIVSDTGAPALVLPGNMTVEATSASGAVVDFVATANDEVNGSVPVTCTPSSGSIFPLGATTVNCSASDTAEIPNTANGSFIITVVDTTPPVITLTGAATMTLTVGGTYTEEGATANDGESSLLVTITGTVDTATPGTYTLTYTTTDTAEHTVSTTRTVQVNAVVITDTTAPVISEVTSVPTSTNDTTPSYTFTTDEAGTITLGGECSSTTTSAVVGSNTITFNTLTEGYYAECTLTVTDAANNISTVLPISPFTIDTTPPTITLNGSATMALAVGSTYIELGATANDGESSLKVAVTGSVNANTPGTYVLTYMVTDNAGNTASVIRTVSVESIFTPPPTTEEIPQDENNNGGGGGGGGGGWNGSGPRIAPSRIPTPEPAAPVVPVPAPTPTPDNTETETVVETADTTPAPNPTPATRSGVPVADAIPFNPEDATLDIGGGASPEDVPEVEETFDPKDATLDIGGWVSPEGNNNALLLWLSGIALSLGLMWWFIAWRRRDEEEEGTRRAR